MWMKGGLCVCHVKLLHVDEGGGAYFPASRRDIYVCPHEYAPLPPPPARTH